MGKNRANRENGDGGISDGGEHELVTMARGLAEIAAAHNLSELIVDSKPSLDIAPFRFGRFAEGAIGKPRNVL